MVNVNYYAIVHDINVDRNSFRKQLDDKTSLMDDWDIGEDLAGYIRLQAEVRVLRQVLDSLDSSLSPVTPF